MLSIFSFSCREKHTTSSEIKPMFKKQNTSISQRTNWQQRQVCFFSGLKPLFLTHIISMCFCSQSWRWSAVMKLRNGTSPSWGAVPCWASVTSQWVFTALPWLQLETFPVRKKHWTRCPTMDTQTCLLISFYSDAKYCRLWWACVCRRSFGGTPSFITVWLPAAWWLPFTWTDYRATSSCSFRSSICLHITSGGCVFKLVTN